MPTLRPFYHLKNIPRDTRTLLHNYSPCIKGNAQGVQCYMDDKVWYKHCGTAHNLTLPQSAYVHLALADC